MAPRAGLPRHSICKKLDRQTSVTADTDAKSVSSALANRQPEPGEKHRPPAPRIKIMAAKDGAIHITTDLPSELANDQVLLMKELGTTDIDFLDGLLGQLADIGTRGRKLERGLNFMFSLVKGVQPRDQIEAMLAAQMAAVHDTTMTFAQRLAHADTIQQRDSAERALNKLARTFAAQLEALKRYRTGGEQRVTVEHVTVNDGGQAIVGNIAHRGGGTSE